MEQALSQPENLVPAPQTDIDKMFSGLGIDPFAFNSKPEKSETPMKNTDASSLTIEDKQRLVLFFLHFTHCRT